MLRQLLSAAALLAALSTAATADTLWVDAANPNCPGSGTAADPFCSIQAAVDAAAPLDTISVLPGVYVENVWILNKSLTLTGRMGAQLTTIAGVDEVPTITVLGAGSAGTVIEHFTITGGKGLVTGFNPFHTELAGAGIYSNADVTVRHNVIEGNAFDTSMSNTWTGSGGGIAIVEDAVGIIHANLIRSNTCTQGGGIYYSGNDAGEIRGNVIEDHGSASGRGGGMVVDSSAPLVTKNVIRNNVSTVGAGLAIGFGAAPLVIDNVITGNYTDEDEGGGILIIDSAPVVRGNTITDNSSQSLGGGICTLNSNAVIADNLIQDNLGRTQGGGIWSDGSDTIVDNEIADNFTFGISGGIAAVGTPTIARNVIRDNEGAGLTIWSGSPLVTDNLIVRNGIGIDRAKGTIRRNTIVDNTYDGITVDDDATPLIESCIVFDNGPAPANEIFVFSGIPTVAWCDVRGGHAGTGNTDSVPQFVDAAADDFRLAAGSPCIDAGDPGDLVCGVDAAEHPRRLDGQLDGLLVVDMGAHEFGHVTLTTQLSPTHLAVETAGTPGLPVFMVIALEPGLSCISAYGSELFDLAGPWSLFGWGDNPTLTVLTLPDVIPVPSVVLQALVLADNGHRGNLSNAATIVFP